MEFVIITGMSGAGKTTAVHIMEDIGYYCIDNVPPMLIANFVSLCLTSNVNMDKVAFVVDARSGESITSLSGEIAKLKKTGYPCEVLFLEASDETLIMRYKETRRKHPHAKGGSVTEGIETERRLLAGIRTMADHVIDTDHLLTKQFREQLLAIFDAKEKFEKISVNIVSFGFKRGIPLDTDLLFDVRFLPNPFYEPDLRQKTGLCEEVKNYVMDSDDSQNFFTKLTDMVEFLLPRYAEEGKMQLVIAIGCTGGKHRSVTVAEALAEYLQKKNYYTVLNHRDIQTEHK